MDLKASAFCPRKELPKGSKVYFTERQYEYTILQTVGSGANAIVYEATYPDNVGEIHHVLLKECYPFGLNIHRTNDEQLLWESSDKETALTAFSEMYTKLMQFQNEDVGNSPSLAYDKFDQNNTSYIVFEQLVGARTFEDYSREELDLLDIIEVGIALTRVVGNYHKKGYLHLDIKPSNFLVFKETKQLIKLFDIDTVTPKENINNVAITYSEGYAAPEQTMRVRSKICEATDIYAIGAVLFTKITGKKVSSDDTSVFAFWDFDSYFEKANPCLKRMLTDVFHKTLAANVKRRYQTTTELESALIQIRAVLQQKEPFVLSSYPRASENFIGRNRELAELEKLLQERNIVFIHGDIGGIGKTELAKKYAELHCNEYDAIVFAKYNGSLKNLVQNIEICNCTTDDFDEKFAKLKQVCQKKKENVLLIVDNFDVSFDSDKFLEDFLQLQANILFTTRTNFEDYTQLTISSLPEEELGQLFLQAANLPLETDAISVRQLLQATKYHTLLTVLVAKQIKHYDYTIQEICNKLFDGLERLPTHNISVRVHEENQRNSILGILKILFDISNLDKLKKDVLSNLYYLDFCQISIRELREIADKLKWVNFSEQLNLLIETGWITISREEDERLISLHPLICELIKAEIAPNPKECHIYQTIESAKQEIFFKDIKSVRSEAETAILHANATYLSASYIDLLQKNHIDYVLNQLWNMRLWNIYVADLFATPQNPYWNLTINFLRKAFSLSDSCVPKGRIGTILVAYTASKIKQKCDVLLNNNQHYCFRSGLGLVYERENLQKKGAKELSVDEIITLYNDIMAIDTNESMKDVIDKLNCIILEIDKCIKKTQRYYTVPSQKKWDNIVQVAKPLHGNSVKKILSEYDKFVTADWLFDDSIDVPNLEVSEFDEIDSLKALLDTVFSEEETFEQNDVPTDFFATYRISLFNIYMDVRAQFFSTAQCDIIQKINEYSITDANKSCIINALLYEFFQELAIAEIKQAKTNPYSDPQWKKALTLLLFNKDLKKAIVTSITKEDLYQQRSYIALTYVALKDNAKYHSLMRQYIKYLSKSLVEYKHSGRFVIAKERALNFKELAENRFPSLNIFSHLLALDKSSLAFPYILQVVNILEGKEDYSIIDTTVNSHDANLYGWYQKIVELAMNTKQENLATTERLVMDNYISKYSAIMEEILPENKTKLKPLNN